MNYEQRNTRSGLFQSFPLFGEHIVCCMMMAMIIMITLPLNISDVLLFCNHFIWIITYNSTFSSLLRNPC